eukprot:GHUV01020769.1.p1 GENE.GHUV01020769.1~~GHUV01020769.1.p1  ORF type:complete len:106 (+),score=11.71 GHUV01020769.1:1420-1737(+)
MMITNYDVTYFLLRNTEDVTDKVLQVSPPVAWNSTSPTGLACLLYVLREASDYWDRNVKAVLKQSEVPITPEPGHIVVLESVRGALNKSLRHGFATMPVARQGRR